MLDTARRLIAPSARSDVPPFMVMDVMAAAARIEARWRARRCTWRSASRPRPRRAPRSRAAKAALDTADIGYTAGARHPGAARSGLRGTMPRLHGVTVEPERIVVTTGSSAGFILAFLALFEPGDRVAVACPGYPPYRHILTALGCEPVMIEISEATRWSITIDALLEAHRRTPLKGVLVASPANPTGTMMRPDALAELIAAAEGEGIRFISDEIYHGLDYAFPAETAAKFSDNAVIINSFSKYFCMTGWRVGWMVVPDALVRPIERLQQNLAISVPTLSQVAAAAAFDGRDEMEAVKHGYEENRRILVEGLPEGRAAREFLPVDGAFYLYADVSRFTDDSFDFAKRMLEEAGVAATPGIDFDPVDGKHFMRFSYAGSAADMREAVERIGRWLQRLESCGSKRYGAWQIAHHVMRARVALMHAAAHQASARHHVDGPRIVAAVTRNRQGTGECGAAPRAPVWRTDSTACAGSQEGLAGAVPLQPGPGRPEYEERQAELRAVAEARRQREEARARQKAAEEAARAEAARLKAEREAEAARKAAEEAARTPPKRPPSWRSSRRRKRKSRPRCSPSRRPRATPATRRARRPRRSGGAGTERSAQNSTSSSSTSSGSDFASSIHSCIAGSAMMAAQ